MERSRWQRREVAESQTSIKEVARMQKQTLAIAVETKNGIVQRIGKSAKSGSASYQVTKK